MANIKGAVVVNKERCKGCELCVVACPCQVLALQPTEVNDKGLSLCFYAESRRLYRVCKLWSCMPRRVYHCL